MGSAKQRSSFSMRKTWCSERSDVWKYRIALYYSRWSRKWYRWEMYDPTIWNRKPMIWAKRNQYPAVPPAVDRINSKMTSGTKRKKRYNISKKETEVMWTSWFWRTYRDAKHIWRKQWDVWEDGASFLPIATTANKVAPVLTSAMEY